MAALPETWDALVDTFNRVPTGTWVRCIAWAVGGGDPDNCDIRVAGGRAVYTNAWCVFAQREGDRDRVRLARLDPGPVEVVRWLGVEDVVEVRRRTPKLQNEEKHA